MQPPVPSTEPTKAELLAQRQELQERCLAQEGELQRLLDLVTDRSDIDAATKMLMMMLQVQNSNLLRRINTYRRENAQLQNFISTGRRASVPPEANSARLDTMNVPFIVSVVATDAPAGPLLDRGQCRRRQVREDVSHALHRLRTAAFDLRQEVRQHTEAIGAVLTDVVAHVVEGIATLELQLDTAFESLADCKALLANGRPASGSGSIGRRISRGDYAALPQ